MSGLNGFLRYSLLSASYLMRVEDGRVTLAALVRDGGLPVDPRDHPDAGAWALGQSLDRLCAAAEANGVRCEWHEDQAEPPTPNLDTLLALVRE